jgi:hypothetical protein
VVGTRSGRITRGLRPLTILNYKVKKSETFKRLGPLDGDVMKRASSDLGDPDDDEVDVTRPLHFKSLTGIFSS